MKVGSVLLLLASSAPSYAFARQGILGPATPLSGGAQQVKHPRFQAGDFYFIGNNPDSTGYTVWRVDGVTGSSSPLLRLLWSRGLSVVERQTLAFDPFRQRLVMGIGGGLAIPHGTVLESAVLAINASGLCEVLTYIDPALNTSFRCCAPTGDGRIYLAQSQQYIQYLDSVGVQRTLMDETGTSPVVAPWELSSLYYDSGTDSLFAAAMQDSPSCPSGGIYGLVFKYPLSPSGSHLNGPPQWEDVCSSAGSFEIGQIGSGPGNQLILSASIGAQCAPRLMMVDRWSLQVTDYCPAIQSPDPQGYAHAMGLNAVYDVRRGMVSALHRAMRVGAPWENFSTLDFWVQSPTCGDPASSFNFGSTPTFTALPYSLVIIP